MPDHKPEIVLPYFFKIDYFIAGIHNVYNKVNPVPACDLGILIYS